MPLPLLGVLNKSPMESAPIETTNFFALGQCPLRGNRRDIHGFKTAENRLYWRRRLREAYALPGVALRPD